MRESVTEQARVIFLLEYLLWNVDSFTNKDRERLVPAAAVIPAVQVAATFVGSKTSVACLTSFL